MFVYNKENGNETLDSPMTHCVQATNPGKSTNRSSNITHYCCFLSFDVIYFIYE